jgi:hypothetical protein
LQLTGNTKTVLVAGGITALAFLGLTIEDPSRLFGLSAGSTCESYNTSDIEYQVAFPDKCGCLYPKQADALDTNSAIREAVKACFVEEMKHCRGWEKIGKIYRACLTRVTGIADGE